MKRILFLCVLGLSFGIILQAQSISEVKVISDNGEFTNPVMSPDGEHLLMTHPEMGGVYLLDLQTHKITTVSTQLISGYGYSWSTDSEKVYFMDKNHDDFVTDAQVVSYDLRSEKEEIHPEINPAYIDAFIHSEKDDDIFVYTDPYSLMIMAERKSEAAPWAITKGDGQFYSPILSHDQKKVIVHEGPNVYVYHTDGSGMIADLGMGIATSWSKDDQYVIGFLDESSDGHEIDNSELYLFDIQQQKKIQLTDTPDIIEMEPRFYGEAQQIIFADEKEGKIYSAQLNLKN